VAAAVKSAVAWATIESSSFMQGAQEESAQK
jgi:hypothetical protein